VLSDNDIDAFSASTRRRKHIVNAIVILIPVSLFAMLGRDCYRQHTARVAREDERHARYQERQERKEAAEVTQRERRRIALQDPNAQEALAQNFAQAAPLRAAAAESFRDALVEGMPEDGHCASLGRSEVAEAIRRYRIGTLSQSQQEQRMMADVNRDAKRNQRPTRARPSSVPVTWVDGDGPLESTLLREQAILEQDARAEVNEGLYPRSTSWSKPQGWELVVKTEVFAEPQLRYGRSDTILVYEPGIAIGVAYLWNHSQQRVQCAGHFEAQSAERQDSFKSSKQIAEIGPGQAARFEAKYRLSVDFEHQIASSIADALGLP